MPEPITFEILWLDEPEDTRPSAIGNLTSIRIADVTIVRRQNLTRACIYAANQLRMRSNTGFVVRRKRDA
jgi:hypothetical protein